MLFVLRTQDVVITIFLIFTKKKPSIYLFCGIKLSINISFHGQELSSCSAQNFKTTFLLIKDVSNLQIALVHVNFLFNSLCFKFKHFSSFLTQSKIRHNIVCNKSKYKKVEEQIISTVHRHFHSFFRKNESLPQEKIRRLLG